MFPRAISLPGRRRWPGCEHPAVGSTQFSDDFDARELDAGVWVPHYLPMWSSRAETAATYTRAGPSCG